jgi:hypothetical protein
VDLVSLDEHTSSPSGTVAEVRTGDANAPSQGVNDSSTKGGECDPVLHVEGEAKTVAQNAGEFADEKGPSASGSAPDAKQEKNTKETNKGVTGKANEAKTAEKRKADEKDNSIERDGREISSTQGTISKRAKKDTSVNNGAKRGPGRPKSAANGDKTALRKKKVPAVGKTERKTRSQGAA